MNWIIDHLIPTWLYRPFASVMHARRRRKYGCTEKLCRGAMVHRPCAICGWITCGKTTEIDPGTLRRHYVGRCTECSMTGIDHGQTALRRKRTEYDWTRPIPDQYPGLSRTTIRNFLDSGDSELVLEEAPVEVANVLNGSIRSLGFGDDCYAEQRANTVVLRRAKASA